MENKLFMDFSDAFTKVRFKLDAWLDQVIVMLPNFILAILLLLAFVFIGKLIRSLTNNILDKISQNTAINRLSASVIYFIVVIIGMFAALGVLQLDKTVTSLLAGAGIVGLALSFAFQDTFANFISGVIIATRKPFRIGDLIESNDHFGAISRINLRSSVVRTPQGQEVIIPNKMILQNPIINYSTLGVRRIDLEGGISYGDDLEKVKQVSSSAIEKIEYLIKNREVEFFFTEFGDSSINFVVRYWIKFSRQKEYYQAQSDGIMNLKKAFDENDITIPFPIRTLDFGIKGGQKLNEVLPGKGRIDN